MLHVKRTLALVSLALAGCADYSDASGPSPDAALIYGMMMSRPTYQMAPLAMPAPLPVRPVMYQRTGPGMWMAY